MSEKNKAAKPKSGETWTELGKTVLYAGLIAIGIRTFLFQPFNIPTGSMENTLMIGDYLFVEKFAYGYSHYSFPFNGWPIFNNAHGNALARSPHRGDVVVFKMPNRDTVDFEKDFIKRVIGLPGDRVQMIDDILYLNGKQIPRQRVADFVGYLDGVEGHWPQYRETLPGGKSYIIIDKEPDGRLDNTRLFVVPEGHYFMMGDNRDNSDDSRDQVGYVPAENLEGKALIRFFSINDSARLWEIWKWPFAIRCSRLITPID